MSEKSRKLTIMCPGHSRPLAKLQYSPFIDGSCYLVSACHDKLPMLRRGDTGDWIGTFEGHKGAVWSTKLNNTATQAVTGSADFSAKLWDALTGDELHSFAHKHIVKSVEFLPTGKKFVSAGHEKILRVFNLEKPEEDPDEVACGEQIRNVVCIDESTVATGDIKGQICIWDLRSNEAIHTLSVGSDVMDLEASRGGTTLTVASGMEVSFFDTVACKMISSYKMPMSFIEEGGASLHPTASKFIAGGSDLWVRVFDLTTGKELECHRGHHGPVRCARYAPDGKSYATGSEDGTIRIWQSDPVE